MQFFDTHAHLGLICDSPVEQLVVVQEAQRASVNRIISVCNSLYDFNTVYENLRSAVNVYYAVGVSPSEVQNPGKDWLQCIEQKVKLPQVIAIGETGLDYFRKYGDKKSQIELFIAQLDLASKLDLPVIIHNRGAGQELLEILKDRLPPKGGVLHCYSENAEYARRALKLNLYFSFAGNVTYRNARNLHETVQLLPLNRIVIESEAPFMVPAEFRNKRNVPKYLPFTAQYIASLLKRDNETVATALWDNACKLFGLPKD
ncbi:MAG: TatD family hydrolase [Treponema sp.]|jgi:TatD DNase family protein|nr:TatD family hydrolase [Treponema sp.]